MMEKGLHAMENSVVAAMVTFHHQLKRFPTDLTRCEDEGKVLIEDLVTRFNEVEDLKI